MAVPQYPMPVTGGLERQAHELAKALIAMGLEVCAISGTIADGKPGREVVDKVAVTRIGWRSQGPGVLTSVLRLWTQLWRMRRDYDVVHLHNLSWFGTVVSLGAAALNKPVLLKLPNVGAFGIPGIAAGTLGKLRVSLFKRSAAIVAMAEESVRELRAIGYPERRILCITNGIVSNLAPPVRRGGKTPVRVVFVGRISAEKGLPDLLEAWRGLGDGKAELLLYGQGPQEDELRKAIAETQLGATVKLCGYTSNPAEIYRDADIFVLPSLAEGNSNAILEAMNAGLPVVSTGVGGTPILVGPAGADYIVAPGDRPALARALRELIGDEGKRRALGAAMRERVARNFDMAEIAGRYCRVYQFLHSGRRDEVSSVASPLFLGV
ncbi:MAG TPA: glycosyltransferase family 4 protein [Rhizomicrobium sp.]